MGETGVGKTTICQILAEMNHKSLNIVNCHMHTEAADFLGSMRPVRATSATDSTTKQLFEWRDGPLVDALKNGMDFLVDEISLADDSVLERLNSLLEEERTLLLAENVGGEETSAIKAHTAFRLVATMNPSGDFGKKELSAALRNRFTEIWCTQSGQQDGSNGGGSERRLICSQRLSISDERVKRTCVDTIDAFACWLPAQTFAAKSTLSIRDLIAWIQFVNVASGAGVKQHPTGASETSVHDAAGMHPVRALVHGACLVFVDSLSDEMRRAACMRFLFEQIDTSLKAHGTTGFVSSSIDF